MYHTYLYSVLCTDRRALRGSVTDEDPTVCRQHRNSYVSVFTPNHTHTQGATFISHTLMSYWPHSTLEGRSHTFMQCFILTAAIMSGATVAHLCSSVSDTHAIFHFIAGCTVVGSLRRSLIISITLLGSLSAAGASKHRASLHWSSEILLNTLPWPHDLLHQGHREVEQEVLDYSAIALIFPSL